MRPLAAILAAAALTGTAPVPVRFAETGPLVGGPADTAEIIASATDRYSRMTVPVTIAGQPFRFMIDTGAEATVVTPRLRDRLQLPPLGVATVVGMAAAKQVQLFRLDDLEFADRVFDGLEAPLLDAQHIGADGILGLDSLQNLRVLIDFREQTIAVDDAAALGGDSGYEIVVRARRKLGRLIITDAEVDGVRTAVIIDTGAQGSMGNRALQRRLGARNGTVVTSTDVTGSVITGNLSAARQITIGSGTATHRLGLTGVQISYADAPAFAALGLANKPALVLGIEDLRAFDRVAIDFAQHSILFDLPPGTARPANSIQPLRVL